jgi:ribonuclease R
MTSADRSQHIHAWRQAILAEIAAHPDRPLKTRALARELSIANSDYTPFRTLVREMLTTRQLVLGPGRTLRTPDQTGQLTGTFRADPRGFGFVTRPGQPDVYIGRRRTRDARDGDTVAVRLLRGRRDTPELRGTIVQIVARAQRRWVGVLQRIGRVWHVTPQGRKPLPTVQLDRAPRGEAGNGDLVVVEPTDERIAPGIISGRLVAHLGDPADARNQIEGVVQQHGLRDSFPAPVRDAARRAAARFGPQAFDGRDDLRDLLCVTIDPPDARDYDDAISIETQPGGHVRLGVHIADVAHFVPADGPVDREARARSTSVYFPGRVLPMLPESLSSEVCCLRPNVPRLAKTVYITYDQGGRVVDTALTRSVIESRARLTYQEVSAALAGDPHDLTDDVIALLKDAQRLAQRIRRRRIKDGMIVLTLPELEVTLDDAGNVTRCGPTHSDFSHTIIEMFMVEANEAVSRTLTAAGLPHLRRIHPPPDPTAAEGLAPLSPVVDFPLPARLDRDAIRRILDAVRGEPSEPAVNFVLLRHLEQAIYSHADVGHFALASKDYCHFTSPIRRYPDLTVHRLVDRLLNEQAGKHYKRDQAALLSEAELSTLGYETSAAERRAIQADREAERILSLMHMRQRVGQTLHGIVSGVTRSGVFVQLQPDLVEGFVPVRNFGADEWVFERTSGTFTGLITDRLVHVGLALRIKVVHVDITRQEMDLAPADGGPIGVVVSAKYRPTSRRSRRPARASTKGRPRRGRRS